MGYYMSTTVIAVILGIILVSVIHPGRPGVEGDDEITKVRSKKPLFDTFFLCFLNATFSTNSIFYTSFSIILILPFDDSNFPHRGYVLMYNVLFRKILVSRFCN